MKIFLLIYYMIFNIIIEWIRWIIGKNKEEERYELNWDDDEEDYFLLENRVDIPPRGPI